MPAYRMLPACKDYLWGGHKRLREDFGVQSSLDPLAEAWVLSCHPDGPSVLADGPFAGWSLREYLDREGWDLLGTNCKPFGDFPLLVKLIDAEQNLSVQVHPSDAYALAQEGQYGKTEMWVVLDAVPGACLYYGFQKPVSREEFARHIQNNTLMEILRAVPVKPGDVFFIPSGTLHAIGAGLVIAEIQQNSNITYRVFDYGRAGPDGKTRPLHVEKALAVTNLGPVRVPDFGSHLGECPYFVTDGHDGPFVTQCGPESFLSVLVTSGSGTLTCGGETREIHPGDCFFLPAGSGECRVEGPCRCLSVRVPETAKDSGI